MKIKVIVIAYLVINIILALVPDFQGQVASITAHWNDILRVSALFLFEPAEYVWKWIIGLLITVLILFNK